GAPQLSKACIEEVESSTTSTSSGEDRPPPMLAVALVVTFVLTNPRKPSRNVFTLPVCVILMALQPASPAGGFAPRAQAPVPVTQPAPALAAERHSSCAEVETFSSW